MGNPHTEPRDNSGTIFHICPRRVWNEAIPTGEYTPASLRSAGFIHCSAAGQLLGVANSLYSGEQGLVILRIDPELLEVSVIYEDCYDLGEQFPHVYGPLRRAAVTEILSFPPGRDGQFTLPAGLELPT